MQNMEVAYKRGIEGRPAPKWCSKRSPVYKSYLKGRRIYKKNRKGEKYMSIKKLRTKLELTQIEFAKLLGTTQMTVSTWENGKCPQYIDKLAEMALEKLNDDKTRP